MNVIVVDDVQMNLTLLEHLLAKLPDCVCHPFLHPSAALAWCDSNVPDLLIVDYMMPDTNGIEFIARFRERKGGQDIPILMITASDEREVCYLALQAGANDFLTKPVDRLEFLARTRNMLALRRSQRFLEDRADWLAVEVKKATAEVLAREKETIVRLSKAVDSRDPETGAHVVRMANYAHLIASRLGMSVAEQDMVLEAAPMHDIGKVGIPDYILLKPGKLTPEEFEVMKSHTLLGYEILRDSESRVLVAGSQIALAHHERYDGSGYPHGLRGADIPVFARIVAVADVFDALTSERPYKAAWSMQAAKDYLEQHAGTHFDPECVRVFLSAAEEIQKIRDRFTDPIDNRRRHGDVMH